MTFVSGTICWSLCLFLLIIYYGRKQLFFPVVCPENKSSGFYQHNDTSTKAWLKNPSWYFLFNNLTDKMEMTEWAGTFTHKGRVKGQRRDDRTLWEDPGNINGSSGGKENCDLVNSSIRSTLSSHSSFYAALNFIWLEHRVVYFC